MWLEPLFAKVGDVCTLPGTNEGAFFGIPHWWQYMQGRIDPIGQCAPHFRGPEDLFPIGLAILGMLLFAAGLIAVISIIIAGWQYVVAVGNAEKITNARKRIVEALVGLGVALIATAVVSFIGRYFQP